MRQLVALAALLATVNLLAVTTAPVNYHLEKTYVLGGSGGWDYLTYDAASKRLFISRGSHVMIVDPQTGTTLGDIPNTPGVHGIALAPELGKGFTSNGADGSVTVFDLSTLTTIATIQTGAKNPDGIAYDPASSRVFTFNGGSNDATVIDARTNAVVATIPLGGRPEFPAVDGRGMVYDNVESTSEIVAIDARSAKLVARFALGSCTHPSGLSIDAEHRRLFTACTGRMGVVDADSGKLVAAIPTGAGTDATRYDPATGLAFASNGRDATLTIVHEDAPDHFTTAQNVQTVLGARTMALDPQTGDLFLVTAKLIENPQATSYRDRYTAVPGSFELLVYAPGLARSGTTDIHSLAAARAYILQSEREWVATNPEEVALVKRIVAGHYVWIDDGKVSDKAGALRDAATGPGDVVVERVDSLNICFFGDTAIVHGASTSVHKGGRLGHAVFVDTWVLQEGRWQIVASADVSVPHKI
ncbi:MAG TPA: DUF4440 domain-containing protein [Candidatus Cybelea sp.]|nr:DUF4440 domain-containing protein [Candidatus Cybelea sp.]